MLALLLLLAQPVATSSVASEDAALLVHAGLELRPAPRIVLDAQHRIASWAELSETLTIGLGSFPDLELRAALLADVLDPIAPFLALRVRRIHLDELPPVEMYGTIGVAFSTDPRRVLALAGGAGLRLQLPPLTPEAASDFGSYLAENVALELFINARFRVW